MRYLITYSYDGGSGSDVVSLPRPIASEDDKASICQQIGAKYGFVHVTITRLTLLPADG